MLNPSVETKAEDGILMAEFWDCHRLDPKPVRDLRESYEKHILGGGRPIVLADLRGIGFAGSAALGGFVALRKVGARVIFYNVEPTVREVFRVSNLDPLFGFATDLEHARRELESGASSVRSPGSSAQTPIGPSLTPPAPPSRPPLRRRREGSA